MLLGGLVALSTVLRYLLARRDPAPWIFNDEIQYSELAKSLANDGELAIRGVDGAGGFGFVYSALIAPAFAVFDSAPAGWEAAKAVNSLLMSAAAVPVYFLARRVAGPGYALVAAAVSVAIPALMFTGTIMTENLFYPLVGFWALAAVRALERPTILRQLVPFVLIGVAFYTRAQAVVLVPALVGAYALVLVLDALSEPGGRLRRLWQGLKPYWPTWTLLALGAVFAIGRHVSSGAPLREVLGSYGGVTHLGYEYEELDTWALYHLAELDIFLGALPFAAFLLVAIVGLRPHAARELRVLAAVAVALVFTFLGVVSAYASSPVGDRILERNFFHVTPVLCVALAAWLSGRAPRPWWAVAPAAMLAGSLTLALPLNNFLNGTIVHSTPGLLPVWRAQQRLGADRVDEVVAIAAIAAAAIFAFAPRRFAPAVAAVLLLFFVASARPVEAFTNHASRGSFESNGLPRDWVDRAIPDGARVDMVWMGGANAFPWFVSEVFNHRLERPYTLTGAYDGLVSTFVNVRVEPDGSLADLDGRRLRLPYVMTDDDTTFEGEKIATNGAETMSLWRTSGVLTAVQRLDGLFSDGWSGPQLIYRRYGCRGGSVRLLLESSPAIHPDPFSAQVSVNGVPYSELRVRPSVRRYVVDAPLRRVAGICDVSIATPTGSAHTATPGDLRQLGLRVLRTDYSPR